MVHVELEGKEIQKIIKKVIEEIDASREQIFKIIDSIRSEEERLLLELRQIQEHIHKVIEEVDQLEKQDKVMRLKLAEVSSNFARYKENDIRAAYDRAADCRVALSIKRSEEEALKERRNHLELSIRQLLENIKSGERIMNQIGVALGYLEGGILSALEEGDKASEMRTAIRILEAQENERKRIARDIHDGPAQHMAGAMMQVDICKKVLQKNLEDGFTELDLLREQIKGTLKEVRGILFDLRPAPLEELGLIQTIENMVKDIEKDTGMFIKTKLKPLEREIEPMVQVAAYRMIQEVFSNIKKHAKAKHAEVKLDFGTKYLILNIADDGGGFDVEETLKRVKEKGSSYGLTGIIDRVKQLQGEVEIQSSKEKGTLYYIKLPMNREVGKGEKAGD